ncbi:PEBP-like protein, partial [Aureobasidium melanogenum]|uniref:PEBP-like protein n=1 Tax=Aureobasidium melanogenum (strain CBS 110374) TaxID=1043003 RepID=A0A074VMW8_AURM1
MLFNMLVRYFMLSVLAERVVSFVLPSQEILTSSPAEKDPNAILSALRDAEVIPDVLDTFSPLLSLTANWSSSAETSLGNTLPPSQLSHRPDIYASLIPSAYLPHGIEYVLALTDPDGPSRDNPKWSQVCHWLGSSRDGDVKELVEYKAPAPPEKTGKHRYVAVVLVPRNGTTEPLDLVVPEERKRWGYDGERAGVREFAGVNGLKVIAANFIYSQNDKQ